MVGLGHQLEASGLLVEFSDGFEALGLLFSPDLLQLLGCRLQLSDFLLASQLSLALLPFELAARGFSFFSSNALFFQPDKFRSMSRFLLVFFLLFDGAQTLLILYKLLSQ